MIIERNGIRKTQNEAKENFEADGKRMLNTEDLPYAIKDKKLVAVMRQEMKDDIFMSGTTITYEKKSEWATITPHKGKSQRIRIPEYRGVALEKVMAEKLGRKYLEVLFGSKKVKELLDTFDTQRSKEIWTKRIEDREDNEERAVVLYFDDFNGFCVNGVNWFDNYYCYSLGVLSDSEPKARSKSNVCKHCDGTGVKKK